MNKTDEVKLLAPWAKNLPLNWGSCRLDEVADVLFSNVDKHTLDKEMPVRLCNYTDVYSNGRINNMIEFMEASAESREIAKFQIKPGDVLATKDSETPDDIAVPALVVEELPGVLCGYHLALIRPRSRRVSGAFLYWLHASKSFRAQYEAKAVGFTRYGLAQHTFRELVIPLPLLTEQEEIVKYLDASCASIEMAVAAKRRQIETLDRVKETIIEAAVNKGIQPHPATRRIDEDWIREIPAHWEVVRIKRVLSQVDYGISEPTGREGRHAVLKMGNIQRSELDLANIDFVDEVSEDLILEEGDLLYNRTNSSDQVGKAAIFRGKKEDGITFASYLVRLRANHRANPYFLNYLFNSSGFLSFVRKLAIPSVQQSNINSTRYCRMLIPLPPREEQNAIRNYLDGKLADITRVVAVISKQIEVLLSYRESLIHECVTGQRRISEADLNRVLVHV